MRQPSAENSFTDTCVADNNENVKREAKRSLQNLTNYFDYDSTKFGISIMILGETLFLNTKTKTNIENELKKIYSPTGKYKPRQTWLELCSCL
jgi:hypothetical protein